ncbi:hypothetical protein MRX96_007972 [Rhipicephalus microplus]
MSTVAPLRPKQGSSQCDASSAQREPPLLVPVSEDPACREVCDDAVVPSDHPISDGRRYPDENPDSNASSAGEATESSDDVVSVGGSRGTLQRRSKLKNFVVPVKIEKPWDSGYLASYHRGSLQATTGTPCQGTSKGAENTSSSSAGEATESSDDVVIVGGSRGTLQRRSKLKNFIVPVKIEKPWDSGYLASYHRGSLQATTGTPCQGTSKGAETTSSSSAGEATESSDDVVNVGGSCGTLQRRSKLKNFIVPVKIEKPWDSGYLASYHRGSLLATTGTPCQGTSKGAETTSSRNKRTVKTKQKACSAVLTCTRIPKVPGEKTPKNARGQGCQWAARDGTAGCEKKTAVYRADEQFEPTAVKKLKAIESTLKAPMPPRKLHAAAATKSKPRGRKKKQEMVPAVGTEVRRRSAGAEATPRFSKTVVRRVKNGETPAPSRKVATQVLSTSELHRRSLKNGRNMKVAVTGSVAEAAAVQVAEKRSKSNDEPPVDGVNASRVNAVPAADEAPRTASTSRRDFVPYGLNSFLEASADVVERRTERLPQGTTTAALHGSSMDLRPVYLRDEISVAFEYSTTRGVILFPHWAAGFQRTLNSTAAPRS